MLHAFFCLAGDALQASNLLKKEITLVDSWWLNAYSQSLWALGTTSQAFGGGEYAHVSDVREVNSLRAIPVSS